LVLFSSLNQLFSQFAITPLDLSQIANIVKVCL